MNEREELLAKKLDEHVTRLSQCLADLGWKSSRAHIEGARNTMQDVADALRVPAQEVGHCGIYDEIAARRKHQISKGYDTSHDDGHRNGEIAQAAASYALVARGGASVPTGERRVRGSLFSGKGHKIVPVMASVHPKQLWPWNDGFNPGSIRETLLDSAALIVAEIERIDRTVTLSSTERARPCDCGFSAEACATNHCMRKKLATSGLTDARYPNTGLSSTELKCAICADTRIVGRRYEPDWKLVDEPCPACSVSSTDKSGAA